jgi:hypothetical protein
MELIRLRVPVLGFRGLSRTPAALGPETRVAVPANPRKGGELGDGYLRRSFSGDRKSLMDIYGVRLPGQETY